MRGGYVDEKQGGATLSKPYARISTRSYLVDKGYGI